MNTLNPNPIAVLAIVKPTEFEELAAKVTADNKIRDYQIGLLEKIMRAYSYIRCVLESSARPVALAEINTVLPFLNKINEQNEIIVKKANDPKFSGQAETIAQRYSDTYSWFNIRYEKARPDDSLYPCKCHTKKSSYWESWKKLRPKSKVTLISDRLKEDLWDYQKTEIRYDRLANFVRHYPWAFPPNVVELHKEMVAREAAV